MKPAKPLKRWHHRKTEVYQTPSGVTIFTERERHPKGKPGRPTKMTPYVIQKLREAWAIGATDIEAALFAGIGVSTLNNYMRTHPELVIDCDALRQLPTFQARGVVVDAIKDKDLETARWYLERKAREEFSKSPEIANVSMDLGKLLEEVERREAREMEVPDDTEKPPKRPSLLPTRAVNAPDQADESPAI